MQDDQAHPGTAVGEREHRKVPSGSMLGIERRVGLLAEPGVEFFAWPRRRDDLDGGQSAGRDPTMAPERQRRLFDLTGQPSPLKMVVETPQTGDIDRAVVHPDTLKQARGPSGTLTEEHCLVDQIENIGHFPRSLHCCHQLPAHTAHSSLEFAWWASSSIQSAVVLATSANTWLNAAM
jgi:hypothetical protein